MVVLESSNSLNSFINFLYSNNLTLLEGIYFLIIFLLNVLSYSNLFIKFFRILCYTRLTFEWFPLINPYVWPFSMFRLLTEPYYAFWKKYLPSLKFEKTSVQISSIVALEALNGLIFLALGSARFLLYILKEIEKVHLP